jgi:hypothetical protein
LTSTEKAGYGGALITAVAGALTAISVAVVQVLPDVIEDEPLARVVPSEPAVQTTAAAAPSSPAPASSPFVIPSAPPPGQQVICINGDGNNNSNNCGLPPQSFGKISYEFGPVLWALYAGPVGDLPPPKSPEEAGDGCSRWDDWLSDTAKLYAVDPVIDFSLDAGENDVAVISRVAIRIFDRAPLGSRPRTFVKCLYGGGSNEFYNVEFNTVTGRAKVREQALGDEVANPRPYPMPPASITLEDGGHAGVRIALKSRPGHMYEGALLVTTSLNGQQRVFTIGSTDNPFRWYASTEDYTSDSGFHYVGWNTEAGTWERNYNPWGG